MDRTSFVGVRSRLRVVAISALVVILPVVVFGIDVYLRITLTDGQQQCVEAEAAKRGVSLPEFLTYTNMAIVTNIAAAHQEKYRAAQFEELLKLWAGADFARRAAALDILRQK